MAVMRYTIIDDSGTVSFVAPPNTLKALVAGCSQKTAPTNLSELLEKASKYDTALEGYVLNGLSVFDEHNEEVGLAEEATHLNPQLEQELAALLAATEPLPEPPVSDQEYDEWPTPSEPAQEITYQELLQKQQALRGSAPARHPVLRVVDAPTRQESLEPAGLGLVIFNLPARRISQVQNNYGVLKRSDRGRYFEDGQATERLYFYRLPGDWTMLP